SWWYIPELGIYHQSKVARRRCLGRQGAMGASGSRQSPLPGPEPWEDGRPRRARGLNRTFRKAAVVRRLSWCPALPDRVGCGMICPASAISLYDDPAAGLGGVPAGLEEHPEHGL